MLLANVRTLDEAVDEVREDKREKTQNRMRQREHQKLERAQLKALSRGFGMREPRQVEAGASGQSGPESVIPAAAPASELPQGTQGAQGSQGSPAPEQLPLRTRPSLQAVKGIRRSRDHKAPVTVDLTAEDDTQALPRLDSLEQKLKDLEQQLG